MHVISYSRDSEVGSGYKWLAGLVSRVCMGVQISRDKSSGWHMKVQQINSWWTHFCFIMQEGDKLYLPCHGPSPEGVLDWPGG